MARRGYQSFEYPDYGFKAADHPLADIERSTITMIKRYYGPGYVFTDDIPVVYNAIVSMGKREIEVQDRVTHIQTNGSDN